MKGVRRKYEGSEKGRRKFRGFKLILYNSHDLRFLTFPTKSKLYKKNSFESMKYNII